MGHSVSAWALLSRRPPCARGQPCSTRQPAPAALASSKTWVVPPAAARRGRQGRSRIAEKRHFVSSCCSPSSHPVTSSCRVSNGSGAACLRQCRPGWHSRGCLQLLPSLTVTALPPPHPPAQGGPAARTWTSRMRLPRLPTLDLKRAVPEKPANGSAYQQSCAAHAISPRPAGQGCAGEAERCGEWRGTRADPTRCGGSHAAARQLQPLQKQPTADKVIFIVVSSDGGQRLLACQAALPSRGRGAARCAAALPLLRRTDDIAQGFSAVPHRLEAEPWVGLIATALALTAAAAASVARHPEAAARPPLPSPLP